jgi:RNA polymerase sigma factor (TIGR02999 family)
VNDMAGKSPHDVTGLLLAWGEGDRTALDRLIPLVHDELHRMAHRYMSGEREGHTLQTTALINEAYLRLVDSGRMHWRNRAHFFAVSAEVMRRILVDFARAPLSKSAAVRLFISLWTRRWKFRQNEKRIWWRSMRH